MGESKVKYILISALLWLGGWVFTILCNIVFTASMKRKSEHASEEWEQGMLVSLYQKQSAEIVADGNSMFTTGLVYTLATAACVYVKNEIICWVIVAVCAIACLPPLLSSIFSMIPQATKMMFIGTTLMALTSVVTSFAQAGMVYVMVLAVI